MEKEKYIDIWRCPLIESVVLANYAEKNELGNTGVFSEHLAFSFSDEDEKPYVGTYFKKVFLFLIHRLTRFNNNQDMWDGLASEKTIRFTASEIAAAFEMPDMRNLYTYLEPSLKTLSSYRVYYRNTLKDKKRKNYSVHSTFVIGSYQRLEKQNGQKHQKHSYSFTFSQDFLDAFNKEQNQKAIVFLPKKLFQLNETAFKLGFYLTQLYGTRHQVKVNSIIKALEFKPIQEVRASKNRNVTEIYKTPILNGIKKLSEKGVLDCHLSGNEMSFDEFREQTIKFQIKDYPRKKGEREICTQSDRNM